MVLDARIGVRARARSERAEARIELELDGVSLVEDREASCVVDDLVAEDGESDVGRLRAGGSRYRGGVGVTDEIVREVAGRGL